MKNSVDTYDQSLYDFFYQEFRVLEGLRETLFMVIESSSGSRAHDVEPIFILLDRIYTSIENQTNEMLEIFKRDIGEITLIRAGYGHRVHHEKKVLSASLEPARSGD